MKGYICVILLLMNGMIYSFAYQEVVCIMEGQLLHRGQIKQHECMLLLCRDDGQEFIERCPEITECPPGKKKLSFEVRANRPFPYCCKTPICED